MSTYTRILFFFVPFYASSRLQQNGLSEVFTVT